MSSSLLNSQNGFTGSYGSETVLELRLGGNYLTSIPSPVFQRCSHLRILKLPSNGFTAVPKGIGCLQLLTHLDLVCAISNFILVSRLMILAQSRNHLTRLDLTELSQLPRLVSLVVLKNRIKTLWKERYGSGARFSSISYSTIYDYLQFQSGSSSPSRPECQPQ